MVGSTVDSDLFEGYTGWRGPGMQAHLTVALGYAVRVAGVAAALSWPPLYLLATVLGAANALWWGVGAAIVVGFAIGAKFLRLQRTLIIAAGSRNPTWTILRNGRSVGCIDNASLAEMRLIALRNFDNAWGQIGVALSAAAWWLRHWVVKMPSAAFWVVLVVGLVNAEAFFALAVAAHPEAFDLAKLLTFAAATGLWAGLHAAWSVRKRGGPTPWTWCHQEDLARMLSEHCGTTGSDGRWSAVVLAGGLTLEWYEPLGPAQRPSVGR